MADQIPEDNEGRRIQRRLAFLEDWRTTVGSAISLRDQTNEATVQFALAGLKAGFIINGGALVAVPALTGILDLDRVHLHPALIAFVSGLFLAALSTFLAFLSTDVAGHAHEKRIEQFAAMVRRWHSVSEEDMARDTKVEIAAGEEADRIMKWANALKWAGIGTFLFSISAFALGVVATWWAFPKPKL